MNPSERRAYALGRESFQHGNVDEAIDHFSTLLETRNDFADVHYMLGMLLDTPAGPPPGFTARSIARERR